MTNDMISIQCEFKMRTPLGFETECKVSIDIWRDYTDAQTIEKVVQWCRKAITTKTIRYPSIDFIYCDGTPYGQTVSRVFGWYGGEYDMVKWGKYGATEKTEGIKPTASLFRKLYLECVDRMAKEVSA